MNKELSEQEAIFFLSAILSEEQKESFKEEINKEQDFERKHRDSLGTEVRNALRAAGFHFSDLRMRKWAYWLEKAVWLPSTELQKQLFEIIPKIKKYDEERKERRQKAPNSVLLGLSEELPVLIKNEVENTINFPENSKRKKVQRRERSPNQILIDRRKELFSHYKTVVDPIEIFNVDTRTSQKISSEEYKLGGFRSKKKHWNILSVDMPSQMVSLNHEGPLTILAFSDFRIHDFDVLMKYMATIKEKPDIILYAGDDVTRFGPTPAELIYPTSESLSCTYAEELNTIHGTFAFGFILRMTKPFITPTDIKRRLLSIWDTLDLLQQAYKKNNKINTIESLQCFLQSLPLQIKTEDYSWGVRLIDVSSGIEILRLLLLDDGRLVPSGSICNNFYLAHKRSKLECVSPTRIGEDKEHVYFYIPESDQQTLNMFEELSHYSKYGVAAIVGNDDSHLARAFIQGKNVYELNKSIVKIGQFTIVGLEGSTCGAGPLGSKLETDVKLKLEFAIQKLNDKDKMLIVSHAPPRGILDRALHFGERPIGSFALKDFLEEEQKACLVVCGHVHSCGGRSEKLNKTTVVNVSSHDDYFSKANMAWLTVESNGDTFVKFIQLPSKFEHLFKEEPSQVKDRLINQCYLSDKETQLFIDYAMKYESGLFDCLTQLTTIKIKYGLPWKVVFMLMDQHVTTVEQLSEEVFESVSCKVNGIYRVLLDKAIIRFKREKAGDSIFLTRELNYLLKGKIIVFDTEYSLTNGALYGFLDLTDGKIDQFWFFEKEKAMEFIDAKTKQECVFVHWGGSDRRIIENELGKYPTAYDLLYFCQTSLVAPLNTNMLKDVHDVLCGHTTDNQWKGNFYEIDGLYKLSLCNRILADPTDILVQKMLMDANKCDLIALQKILTSLLKANVDVKKENEII